MKKALLILVTLGTLAACSPSVEDYIEDPKLLSETLKKCAMTAKEDWGKDCQNATEAAKKGAGNALGNLFG